MATNANSRRLLVEFDKLIRNTNPELEFDTNLFTDTIYMFLTMSQEKVISDTFLQSPDLLDNIQAIKKRSDILRGVIKRTRINSASRNGLYSDGGYYYEISESNYWIFLRGVVLSDDFSTLKDDTGGSRNIVSMKLVSHDSLDNVISDIYDSPIIEEVPIVLESTNVIVVYFDKQKQDAIDNGDIDNVILDIVYLSHPSEITDDNGPSLPEAMYKDIVKIAVEDFIVNYKYKLGASNDR